jgi:protein-L-isoaspartate(D-aspartate) O-methyltransferase
MDFELERKKLVDSLRRRKYITKPEVISAMMRVPRHLFIPKGIIPYAYHDSPQQIGSGQTISAPHMVGIMAEKLDLKSGQRVLEIGGGCGYHAAVVAEIVKPQGHVYSVELIENLANFARENIKKCGLGDTVTVVHGDGGLGLPEHAPYDRIYVTAASPDVPPPLIEQLKDKGKLLVPSGGRHFQTLLYCEKKGKKITRKDYGGCVFVPLRGKYGF